MRWLLPALFMLLINSCAFIADARLRALQGGDGCSNCHATLARQDECYHSGIIDACQTTKCIVNITEEATCDLIGGTCSAALVSNATGFNQTIRYDSNCQYTNPGLPVTWVTHYYGSGCTAAPIKLRCHKTNGQCNGTLITSYNRTPGIVCQ